MIPSTFMLGPLTLTEEREAALRRAITDPRTREVGRLEELLEEIDALRKRYADLDVRYCALADWVEAISEATAWPAEPVKPGTMLRRAIDGATTIARGGPAVPRT